MEIISSFYFSDFYFDAFNCCLCSLRCVGSLLSLYRWHFLFSSLSFSGKLSNRICIVDLCWNYCVSSIFLQSWVSFWCLRHEFNNLLCFGIHVFLVTQTIFSTHSPLWSSFSWVTNLSSFSENYFPWENLSIDWQVWLALRVRNNYLLLSMTLLFFFICLTVFQTICWTSELLILLIPQRISLFCWLLPESDVSFAIHFLHLRILPIGKISSTAIPNSKILQ